MMLMTERRMKGLGHSIGQDIGMGIWVGVYRGP